MNSRCYRSGLGLTIIVPIAIMIITISGNNSNNSRGWMERCFDACLDEERVMKCYSLLKMLSGRPFSSYFTRHTITHAKGTCEKT